MNRKWEKFWAPLTTELRRMFAKILSCNPPETVTMKLQVAEFLAESVKVYVTEWSPMAKNSGGVWDWEIVNIPAESSVTSGALQSTRAPLKASSATVLMGVGQLLTTGGASALGSPVIKQKKKDLRVLWSYPKEKAFLTVTTGLRKTSNFLLESISDRTFFSIYEAGLSSTFASLMNIGVIKSYWSELSARKFMS